MKVLVAHAKCGSGHTVAAKAVYDSLQDVAGLETVIYDLLEESDFHRKWYAGGYRLLVKYLPFVWKWLYNTSDHQLYKRLNTGEHRFLFPRFSKRLIRQQPGLVVSTHFFVSEIAAKLKRKGLIKSKLITIVTDFNVHKTWVHRGTDFYVVASEFTASVLRTCYGVTPDKIKVWGIPLREGFYQEFPVSELLDKYEKPEGLFTALIFSSDYGVGPILELVQSLRKTCGLIVICGKDKKLKKTLSSIVDAKYLRIEEYVDEIWEPMALADVVVLKAGGLSVSECMYLKKPMLFMKAFYGQETENVQYASSTGIGFNPAVTSELITAIETLAEDSYILEDIKHRYGKIPRYCSVIEIKQLIMGLMK